MKPQVHNDSIVVNSDLNTTESNRTKYESNHPLSIILATIIIKVCCHLPFIHTRVLQHALNFPRYTRVVDNVEFLDTHAQYRGTQWQTAIEQRMWFDRSVVDAAEPETKHPRVANSDAVMVKVRRLSRMISCDSLIQYK